VSCNLSGRWALYPRFLRGAITKQRILNERKAFVFVSRISIFEIQIIIQINNHFVKIYKWTDFKEGLSHWVKIIPKNISPNFTQTSRNGIIQQRKNNKMKDPNKGKTPEGTDPKSGKKETADSVLNPEIGGITDEVRARIEEQLRLFEEYDSWEEGGEKSQALRSLYERVGAITELKGTPHAKEAKGVDETPDHIKTGTKEDEVGKLRGAKALEDFIKSVDKPYNFFHLGRDLSQAELEERIAVLEETHKIYKEADADERTYIEELINRMFDVPTITQEAGGYLEYIEGLESTQKSAGAENENLIYKMGTENKSFMFEDSKGAQVLKISKARHNVDFTSIIWLMRNMHVLMLRFNRDIESPKKQTVKIRLVGDDMTIYKDQDTNYKRIIRQPYAKGIPAQEATKKYADDPSFKDAWITFLKEAEAMRETDGIVLDLTDSTATHVNLTENIEVPFFLAPRTPARGKVANTQNVFVHKEEDGSWLFSVIDPDVFDVREGAHKFDPAEHANLGKTMKAKIVGFMNKGRDTTTLGWQDRYMQKELDNKNE
jgi:hypothetical protein